MLLYRLLLAYPKDRLCVLESSRSISTEARRLPGVRYGTFPLAGKRLLQTRLVNYYSAWLILLASRRSRQILRRLGDFRPEAVLTVAHGYGWLTAAAVATKLQIPLHLIVHDDWLTFVFAPAILRSWVARRFAQVYRQAASRLCVSPAMSEEYKDRFGVPGTVLYPSRGPSAESEGAGAAAPTTKASGRPFTLGYAGAVASESFEHALLQAAENLAVLGGRLLVYSPSGMRPPLAEEIARRTLPVEWRAALPSEEVIQALRREADALYVPMSFSPDESANTRLSFPSKLTDYTRSGLPLLIYGPKFCSAIRWAQENPDAAQTVTDLAGPALANAIRQLADDPQHRARLAQGAADAGAKYFSFPRASDVFLRAISN
jgi:glycosyltransferase involved in cell wall biosynthesis